MNRFLAGRKVLVVEDETMILIMIEDMLDDLGCQDVTSVGTVDAAMREIETRHFDGAMLDMNLGGVDSHEVADALADHAIPFIYSTGNCHRDLRPGFAERRILRKPFSFAELTSTLSGIMPRPVGA